MNTQSETNNTGSETDQRRKPRHVRRHRPKNNNQGSSVAVSVAEDFDVPSSSRGTNFHATTSNDDSKNVPNIQNKRHFNQNTRPSHRGLGSNRGHGGSRGFRQPNYSGGNLTHVPLQRERIETTQVVPSSVSLDTTSFTRNGVNEKPKQGRRNNRRNTGNSRTFPFNANAPVFQPGGPFPNESNDSKLNQNKPSTSRNTDPQRPQTFKASKPRQQRKNRQRVSVDVDSLSFRERLIFQLENNKYECMICFQNIGPRQKVWSCKECYHVFHISGGCILDWASKSIGEQGFWNCPACKAKYTKTPFYDCYCGKQKNPTTKVGERPHACGGICGAKRGEDCSHPCNEPCHPGPCPDCISQVMKVCFCGSTTRMVRCGQSIKCSNKCGKLLACGVHECAENCHEGSCNECEVKIIQHCYCGKDSKELECDISINENDKYSCDSPCSGKYKCGIHSCTTRCHDITKGCGSCPTAPERITHCPCGKMSLEAMSASRSSCADPIPTCANTCNKRLLCGDQTHRCRQQCHVGPCPPCEDVTRIECRCKLTTEEIPCSQVPNRLNERNELICDKKCRKKKSCGVHKCQEFCCVDHDLTCFQLCNRRLACGQHFCEFVCHSGQCRPCLNASFTEQYCHCGKTVRLPPIPCGEPPPPCDEPCAREHSCNHPVFHRCHSDQNCPPCTTLVEKYCYGGHEIRKNIPCHFSGVSCGKLCGKPLSCGVHSCDRNCHPGACQEENAVCKRPCNALRENCEHPCAMACHPNAECPETKCMHSVEVTCDCGRRKSKMKCYESVGAIMRVNAALAVAEEGKQVPGGHPGVLIRSLSMEKLSCISCDEDCKKVARNKKLADALSIVTDEDLQTEEPTVTFTESLKEVYRKNPQFVSEVESILCALANKFADVTISEGLSHSFRPMPLERRRFIHEYANLFNMTTVSVDNPPKRSVIVTARRCSSRIPLICLTDLRKYPFVLKAAGVTTLKNTLIDEVKKEPAPVEEGMKLLKSTKKVFKRLPVTIAKPAPLKQQNFFSVLGSDDETSNSEETRKKKSNPVVNLSSKKDPNWWSDEEEEPVHNPDIKTVSDVLNECVNQVVQFLDV